MRMLSLVLAFALTAAPALAADEQSPPTDHRPMFWSGIALGVAGVATSVAAVTFARVTDSSTGNAPPGTYQACVAQKADPIYATNNCDALKAKNLPMLWSGVAIVALGAVLVMGSARTHAEISPGVIRISHTIRF